MKLLATLLLFCTYHYAQGQKYPPQTVTSDLNFLIESIETYNPALSTNVPDFSTKAEEVVTAIKDSLSILEYFAKVSEIVTLSEEGHFGIGKWTDTVHQGFGNDTYEYLPLTVEIIAGKAYLWGLYTKEESIQRGDEIIAINGRSMTEILERLYRYVPSDAQFVGYKDRVLCNTFSWMYYLYIEQPKTFEIKFRSHKSQALKTVTIDALNRTTRTANLRERYKKELENRAQPSINDIYELSFHSNYALLKLKTFSRQRLEKYDVKVKQFYPEIMKKIRDAGVTNLVVDLRNNSGGLNTFADQAVSFFMKTRPATFLKKTVSWKGASHRFKSPKPHKLAFTGQVFVLINSSTYSAASSLAHYLKEYAEAIMIGTESGTRYEGFAAGSKQYVYLPHSNLEIKIPRYHILYPEAIKQKTKNRGVLPTHEVRPTITDLMEQKDPVLDAAIQLINQ